MGSDENKLSTKILSPKEMGITTDGKALSSNVKKLWNGYVKLLISGNTAALKGGKYLGNRIFKKTGTKCITGNKKIVERSILVDDIPCNKKKQGLVAGLFTSLDNIDTGGLITAFKTNGKPKCSRIGAYTVDKNNKEEIKYGYVIDSELSKISSCALVNDGKEREFDTFESFVKSNGYGKSRLFRPRFRSRFSDDPIERIYITTVGVIFVYFIYKLL